MLCVFEWYNEGLSCARTMSVLVFMVGELRWGEKGVPKLLGTRRSGCITEKRNVSRRRFEKKKKFQKFRKTSPPPKVKFLGKPRNTSVNVLAIGRLYIYEYIFYYL